MTTKWLLNCHEFMIRFRGNKPYKLKTDISLTLKSMQQKKECQLPPGNFKQPNVNCVCAILDSIRVTSGNLCARLSDLENETCNLLTLPLSLLLLRLLLLQSLLLLQLLLLLVFIVLNLNKAVSIVHRPNSKPNEAMQKCKRKIFAYVKVRCKYGIWGKARQRQINRNTELLTHTHTHHTHHTMAQCVQKYVYLMPALTSKASSVCFCTSMLWDQVHIVVICSTFSASPATERRPRKATFAAMPLKNKKRKAKNKNMSTYARKFFSLHWQRHKAKIESV